LNYADENSCNHKTIAGITSIHVEIKKRKSALDEKAKDEAASTTTILAQENIIVVMMSSLACTSTNCYH